MEKSETTITFLGTATCVPDAGHDTASFVINRRHLVDTGWYSAIKMLNYGISPLDIETVFISHCHHDHYLGLPHILFYLCMKKKERPPIKIVGPATDIARVVGLAKSLLQPEKFTDVDPSVEIIPIIPGRSLDVGELHVDTIKTVHPVEGLCYKFTDKRTNRSFVYTGDTAYHPPIADFAKGVSLLIHEASYGQNSPNVNNRYGHSGSPNAARIAKIADVERLALVHCPLNSAQQAIAVAKSIFPNTFLPEDGEEIKL